MKNEKRKKPTSVKAFLRQRASKLKQGVWVTCYERVMVERTIVANYLRFLTQPV